MRPSGKGMLVFAAFVALALASACGNSATSPDAAITDSAAPSIDAAPPPFVCVFDYDLTLSSNKCPATAANAAYSCRTTACITYNWYDQCLGIDARQAIAECVRRGAYIGIASHANADLCWNDKVTPILQEAQFPEWTGSTRYDSPTEPWFYPALDDRANWNCDDCAYSMESLPKPEGIARVMRHFGLDPTNPSHRARVIFWDDTPGNIDLVVADMPEVVSVLVPRNGGSGNDGGCGITQRDIDEGWRRVTTP